MDKYDSEVNTKEMEFTRIIDTEKFPYTGFESEFKLDPSTLYIHQVQGGYIIFFICPCGCGEVSRLYHGVIGPPHEWDLDRETITISPSINNPKGCKAHYFIRNGKVEWCG